VKLFPPAPDSQWPMAGWAIADDAGWLPGIYATEEAARLASTIGYIALQELSEKVCAVDGEARNITVEDLETL
jgi:hypothetical protein